MQEATAAGAKATGELLAQKQLMDKQRDLRTLAQELPAAIQGGDLSQVAGQAYGLGDPTIFKTAMDQQSEKAKLAATAAKPGDSAITEDATLRAVFPGMDDAWYEAAKTASSRTQQNREFTSLGSQIDRDADRGLRRETQYEQSKSRFVKTLETNLKKYRENVEAFEKLDELDPRSNIGFWPKVSTIIKKVGMDAGALSDQDMQRFITATGHRTMTQALQYLDLVDPSKNSVDEKTIKAVNDVISKMREVSEKKYQERGVAELNKQVKVGGKRLTDDLVRDAANEVKLVADKKDGNWTFGTEIAGKPQKVDLDVRGQQGLIQMIRSLPPKYQAGALKRLEKFGDKPVSKEYMDLLYKLGAK